MPEGMKSVVVARERIGDGRAEDAVQVGQSVLGQDLQKNEIEEAENSVGDQAVADVPEGLGGEGGAAEPDQVERDGQQEHVFQVIGENFACKKMFSLVITNSWPHIL